MHYFNVCLKLKTCFYIIMFSNFISAGFNFIFFLRKDDYEHTALPSIISFLTRYEQRTELTRKWYRIKLLLLIATVLIKPLHKGTTLPLHLSYIPIQIPVITYESGQTRGVQAKVSETVYNGAQHSKDVAKNWNLLQKL